MRYIKSLYYCLILLFICVCAHAADTSTERMSIRKINNHETNSALHYTITSNYPEIKNVAHSNEINNLIKHTITKIIQGFKNNVAETPIEKIEGLPISENSNTLTVDYKQISATPHFISILFTIDTFYYGAAHPNTMFQSLNYDLDSGKELSLTDIFKSSDYLNMLSKYSKTELQKKLSKQAESPVEVDSSGLKPTSESFKIWNIAPQGLLLTFPPYQVAAYVFGPQEVLVPYQLIKDHLKMDVWKDLK